MRMSSGSEKKSQSRFARLHAAVRQQYSGSVAVVVQWLLHSLLTALLTGAKV